METEIDELETRLNDHVEEIKKIGGVLLEKNEGLEETKTANHALSVENVRLEERAKSADELTEELRGELDKLHDRLRELAAAKPGPDTRGGHMKDEARERKYRS